jgi:hypothetical protein
LRRLGIATAAAVLALVAPAWAASAPSVTTGPATSVTPTTATLNGTVKPNGSGTTYFFQYGTTTNYRSGSSPASAGSGTRGVHVSASLSGLSGNTRYHYRLVAFNSRGISHGQDRTFKTPPIPTTAGIGVVQNPVVFGDAVVISGRLSGPPDVGGKSVALQANPFPYTGFRQVGNSELTASDGSYTFTLAAALITSQLRVVEQSSPGAVSPPVTLNVAVDLGRLRVRHLSGGRISVRGSIRPGVAGARVLVQRLLPHGKVRTVARARTVAVSGGRAVFARRFKLRHSGVYRVVVVPNTGAYVSGMTGPFVLRG